MKAFDTPLPYTPLITIITVVYNAGKVLENTILSVITQNYSNVQFLIIDGGSTDGTVDLLKKYDDKISYWISEPDKGVYDAMNKGLTKVEGEWVYFLGAGDILLDMLDVIAPKLINANTVYYGDVYRKDLLRTYDGKFSPYKFAVLNICHQAMFYPAALFKKYTYNIKYKIQADHALNMQVYGDKDYQFQYFPIIVCVYEGDGYSANTIDLPFFADKLNIIKLNFSPLVYLYALTRRSIARIIKPPYVNKLNT